ncbi:MAG: ABC transporter permease [Candidatus Aminicenantes bacterium]|nr:ABC transporter permease [Candidatus Aminicenantes bacterium]
MSRTTLIIKNDIKRRLRAPLATVLFMIIPFAMTALIGMIFDPGSGTETKLPPIKVLLVDKDQNLASKFLIGAFDQKQLKEMFQATTVSEAEGEKLMKKGKASAMIIIPEHFSEDLADQKLSRLVVVKNPAEEFLPDVVEEFANTMAVGLSGVAQVFADELKIIKLVGNSSLETLSIAELAPLLEMSRIKIMAVKKYLSPLLVGLKTSTIAKPGQAPPIQGFNIFAYILPGMLIMFMLFIIEAFMREIQNERADGKIRRMMFSPLTTRELVLARIVGAWLLGMLICGLAMVMGALVFAIDWGNTLWLFLLVAVTCFWCAAFFGMLNAFFKNKNQAGAFASPIILVSAAFGGSMLPLEQIPAGMRWLAKFTVNNWFITGCRQVVAREIPLAPLLVLLVTALLFAAVAMVALQRRLTV